MSVKIDREYNHHKEWVSFCPGQRFYTNDFPTCIFVRVRGGAIQVSNKCGEVFENGKLWTGKELAADNFTECMMFPGKVVMTFDG